MLYLFDTVLETFYDSLIYSVGTPDAPESFVGNCYYFYCKRGECLVGVYLSVATVSLLGMIPPDCDGTFSAIFDIKI